MASLKDISKACGVSVATVSKALNNHTDIGEETKAHIKKVAKEMGSKPFGASTKDEQDLRNRSAFCR